MLRSQSLPDGVLAILARYAAIVDAPQAWLDSVARPLPVCFWHNPLKGSPEQLLQHLQMQGLKPQPLPWRSQAYRIWDWPTPGNTFPFTAGWYYVQEEVAMTAVVALDPQPHECILDMCAAPGGKTAQIATQMGPGLVIANEIRSSRLPSLSATVSRLGLTQVMTTQADGRSLSFPPNSFDRVLVDAPCSGEGNLRRRRTPRPWQQAHSHRIANAQKRLLSRALDLVKPGGTVVYSTCTFAPEENEAVLDAVLGDRAVVVPFDIPGFIGRPGVTHWQGHTYRQDVSLARRYWPHLNDTGGFFVAKLQHLAPTAAPPPFPALDLPSFAPVPSTAPSPYHWLMDRFGLGVEIFADTLCWASGQRRLWAMAADVLPLPGTPPQTLGIPLMTRTNLGLKPTTAWLQRYGGASPKNVVVLPDRETAAGFLRGELQSVKADVESGYVHVRWDNFELGCGRYHRGKLESQIPKMLRWRSPSPSSS